MDLRAEVIDLASEGYFYPIGSALANGTVSILPISGIHEELLTSVNLAKRGLLEQKFFNVIVEGGVNLDTLLHCDRQSILLNLRIANYGTTSKVKTTCGECDTDFEHDISFAFRAKPFDFSRYERGINKLAYTFPRCKKTVNFRLGTCTEHAIFDKLGWLAFAKAITIDIEGVDNINDFYDYQLGAADSSLFRKHYENKTPGYVTDVVVACPSCKKQRKNKMEVDLGIFGIRPESKMALHSEIFDLCYYSKGAFTEEGVYALPTSMRSFYVKKLIDAKKAEKEAQAAASEGQSPNSKLAKPPSFKK